MNNKLFLCNKRFDLTRSLKISILLTKPGSAIHLNKTSTCSAILNSRFHESKNRPETLRNQSGFKSYNYLPIFNILYKKIQSPLTNLQIRTVMKGGPGYVKFGHGRYKPVLSKYAYFWYFFLAGGIFFVLFFDFENAIFRGLEPQEKIDEFKMKYTRDYKPRAKEIEPENDEANQPIERSNSDESDDEDQEETSKKNEKKSKTTFRDRKVRFQIDAGLFDLRIYF
jgi:hypothetical protein